MPNNQGTRTVDIPVMIYPSVTAKAPVRDKIGQNLERGTDVYNYIEFEDGKRYNGTATWKDNRQPDKNVAGVQNLTALINYPGITTPVEVPVKVWVYNFDFAQPVNIIEVGDTFPKGTSAAMYKHLENGEGLPMDGFKFYWNPETGTSSNQWQSLAYTSTPFVKTGRYDVLYSGNRDFQTSQPGKFIVKWHPNPPIITESNAGEITITPGAVRQIPIKGSGYYAQSNADKIVINRNGRKLTTFIKNQDGRWEL